MAGDFTLEYNNGDQTRLWSDPNINEILLWDPSDMDILAHIRFFENYLCISSHTALDKEAIFS